MKFKFLDKVIIKHPFYKDRVGIGLVIEFRKFFDNNGDSIDQYLVEFYYEKSSGITVIDKKDWFKEHDLSLKE